MFFEFAMERFQSLYENEVDFNLSDSGVHPLTINDLLNEEEMQNYEKTYQPGTEIKTKPTS